MSVRSILLAAVLSAVPLTQLHAEVTPSLRGSPAGMQVQNRIAKAHGLAFYRTHAEILDAFHAGDLLALRGSEDYEVAGFVDLPYLHPSAILFVERLSAQYREACGQKLVVTSAVRATADQPPNAHALSVHPAGMAVDLRVSDRAECRRWLEDAILGMERRGLVDGIREYNPPHYHVAVFPKQYMEYALERAAREAEQLAATRPRPEVALVEISVPPLAAGLVAARVEAESAGDPAVPAEAVALALMMLLPFGAGYLVRRRRG
jgi:hypothetical protein